MRDLNWNDVKIFLSVARVGKLTEAARVLGSDHTTVGRKITALEEALRVTLFDRGPRGYALTSHGEKLVEAAESMESSVLRAQGDIGEADISVSGIIRIGAPEGFGSYFLANRLGALCQRHPELEVELVAMPRLFSLSKREADLAVGLAPPQEGRLLTRKLTDYQLRLYASASYLDSHPKIQSPRDLLGHRFIGYIDELIYTPELAYLDLVGDKILPRLRSSSLIAQLNATKAGSGICILPCFIAGKDHDLLPVLVDEVCITRSFWLMTHANLRDLARVKAAADFLTEEVHAAHALFRPAISRSARV